MKKTKFLSSCSSLYVPLTLAALSLSPAMATAQTAPTNGAEGATTASITQDLAYVQIEALPSQEEAQANAERFAQSLEHVVAFDLTERWHVIALGPYTNDEAQRVLRQLRRERAIPRDSFIVDGSRYITKFFPAGEPRATQPVNGQPLGPRVETSATNAPETQTETGPVIATDITQAPSNPAEVNAGTGETSLAEQPLEAITTAPTPTEPEETVSQARASERTLSRPQKRELQEALQWAGVYRGAIDGLYGRGTRRAMRAWQAEQGLDETGILTTSQRSQLLTAYNAILEDLGLKSLTDSEAGITLDLPLNVVEFARYDPPFVRFDGNGSLPEVQVLLISQSGDRETMNGLFEVMQTLEIVPTQGERRLTRNGFIIEGTSERIHSHTEVSLSNGDIKGFTLIWPAGDEERRARLLSKMRASFSREAGALDPALISPGAASSTDMVSGLAIRKPLRVRSGMFITPDGKVLSSGDLASGCGEIALDGGITMEIIGSGPDHTLLAPTTDVAPQRIAEFSLTDPELRSPVALSGYPYEGVLPRAALTFGQLEALTGLGGESNLRRLSLRAEPSELGGPISDESGAIIGMLSPAPSDKVLPDGVGFAISSARLVESIEIAGLRPARASASVSISPEQLTRELPDMTALLTCWE